MSKSTTKQGTKRKSQGDPPGSRNAKQPKTIDTFFSPKVSVRLGCGLDGVTGDAKEKVLDVVLSDEQVRVMKLVVDEGKNVFFTGSAGTFSCTFSFPSLGASLFRFIFPMLMGASIDGDAAVLLGTGKSLLLRAIIVALKKRHAKNPEAVSVTASTGMAASNIGGIYRFTSQNRRTPFSDISP
jgi:ATP-dependent DNA helicase PIF1